MSRPKALDPKQPLTVRVPASILAGFPDSQAARVAVERLVETHLGGQPETPLSPAEAVSGWREPHPSVTPKRPPAARGGVKRETRVTGAEAVSIGPPRPKYGSRLKP